MTKEQLESKFSLPVFAIAAQILFVTCVGTYLCTSIHFPEFYEHLTKGNWILAHGELPETYIWTTVGRDLAWSDPNWLFEIVVSSVDTHFGPKGLLLLKMFSTVLAVYLFSYLFTVLSKDRFIGTVLAVLVACGIFFHSSLLPSLFAWSLLAAILSVALSISKSERNSPPLLLGLTLLSIIYANVHGSYLFCAFITLAWIKPDRKLALWLAFIFVAAGIFNPYFGAQLLSALKMGINELSLDILLQRNPASIYDFSVAFLVLLWLVFALFWHYEPNSIAARLVILTGAMTLIGFGSAFVLPFALFFLGLLIAQIWGEGAHENKKNLGDAIYRLKTMLSKLSPVGILWLLLCLCIVNASNRLKHAESQTLLPSQEVDFLVENGFEPPLFNEAFIGGYLVYRFANAAGEIPTEIVQSTYSSKLYRDAAIADYSLASLGDAWRDSFRSLAPNTVLCRESSSLYQLLLENPEWQLTFQAQEKASKRIAKLNKNPFLWAVFTRIKP